MKKTSSLLVLLFISLSIFGQKRSPISVETMAGNKLGFNLVGTRQVAPKIVFQSANSVLTDYDYKKSRIEIVSNNSLVYNIVRGIGVGANMQFHFLKGFVPSLKAQFAYGNPDLLLLVSPHLNFMPWLGTDIVAIAQYRPKLNSSFRLFTEAKAMYSYNLEDKYHEISYYNLRLGTTYNDFVTFGAGYNFNYYGPKKINKDKNNYGVFVKFYL